MPSDTTARATWFWRMGEYPPECRRTASHWREAELETEGDTFTMAADFVRADANTLELESFTMHGDFGPIVFDFDNGATMDEMVRWAERDAERGSPR